MNSQDVRPDQEPDGESTGAPVTEGEIRRFLVTRVAKIARLPEDKVDANTPISAYGVDSVHTVELVVEIEDWLGLTVPDNLPWTHPTITAIAGQLAAEGPPVDGPGTAEGSTAA